MAAHTKIRNPRTQTRLRRKRHIRKRISGTAERPRLTVFRSLKHIYVQAIDDVGNRVLASASDTSKSSQSALGGKKKSERARELGKEVGKKLVDLKVESVVFDRNGYIFHGRVKEVAEGAREAGVKF